MNGHKGSLPPRGAYAAFGSQMHCRYAIEGMEFMSMRHAYDYARRHLGYTGPQSTFTKRLCAGATTWAKLCVEPNPNLSEAKRKTSRSKHAEMAEVIAALDARKAGLA